jgi:hypothetical protein
MMLAIICYVFLAVFAIYAIGFVYTAVYVFFCDDPKARHCIIWSTLCALIWPAITYLVIKEKIEQYVYWQNVRSFEREQQAERKMQAFLFEQRKKGPRGPSV